MERRLVGYTDGYEGTACSGAGTCRDRGREMRGGGRIVPEGHEVSAESSGGLQDRKHAHTYGTYTHLLTAFFSLSLSPFNKESGVSCSNFACAGEKSPPLPPPRDETRNEQTGVEYGRVDAEQAEQPEPEWAGRGIGNGFGNGVGSDGRRG